MRKPAPKPGIYPGVPDRDYHRWDACSHSDLKLLDSKTPLHLKMHMEEPEDFQTDAQILGQAVHKAVLEPERFATDYARGPKGRKNTKAYKDELAALILRHPEANFLSPDDFDLCVNLRDAVLKHWAASKMLGGAPECSIVWEDPDYGALCKARLDDACSKIGAIVDLKTAQDASPAGMSLAMAKWGYHLQAAHYLAGANAVGIEARSFLLVCVEKKPPYPVSVLKVAEEAVALAEKKRQRLLKTYADCLKNDHWPGYPDDVRTVSLPGWAWRDAE